MIECHQCGNEIPEHINDTWNEFSKLTKDEVCQLIKYKR